MSTSNNNLSGLIYDAYALIGTRTPIKADCGKLCGKACCKGDAAGMVLFPGEEFILSGVSGFYIEDIEYMDIHGIKLLLCDGKCNRDLRPLACRIFPVAPDINDSGNIGVQADIRGRRMCPIWDLEHVDKDFIESIEKVFALLGQDETMLFFLRLISAEIKSIRRFYKKRC